MTQFVALDVETANRDLASLCQIGLVGFDGDGPVSFWESLLNPEDTFDLHNVMVHDISSWVVRDAPTLPAVHDRLRSELAGQIVVVCHTAFDRLAIQRAFEKYSLPPIECRWLDSARVVRRTWPDFRRDGWGLAMVANTLGIQFEHHVAVEDARASGLIILRAIAESGISIDEWLVQSIQPVESRFTIARDGDPNGPLFGEVVVFTGALSVTRDEAAELAARLGCRVENGVTKRTTLLVVGDQDEWRLAGHEKSSKHRKAEALVAAGQQIRIVGERDFRALVGTELPV